MLLVAGVLAVVVLGRMGGTGGTAALTKRTTTTTVPVTRAATTTTTSTPVTTLPTTTTTTVAPSSVLVQVLNGWTTLHGALYFKNQLQPHGYDVLVPLDALTNTIKSSVVFYVHPAYAASAMAIAQDLGIPPSAVVAPTTQNDSAVPATDLTQADVVVLIGKDISARVPAGYKG